MTQSFEKATEEKATKAQDTTSRNNKKVYNSSIIISLSEDKHNNNIQLIVNDAIISLFLLYKIRLRLNFYLNGLAVNF